jgi:hypothetical protein
MKDLPKPEQHVPPNAERAQDPKAELDKRIPPDEREGPVNGGANSEAAKDALEDEASAEARTKEPEPKQGSTDGGVQGSRGSGSDQPGQ